MVLASQTPRKCRYHLFAYPLCNLPDQPIVTQSLKIHVARKKRAFDVNMQRRPQITQQQWMHTYMYMYVYIIPGFSLVFTIVQFGAVFTFCFGYLFCLFLGYLCHFYVVLHVAFYVIWKCLFGHFLKAYASIFVKIKRKHPLPTLSVLQSQCFSFWYFTFGTKKWRKNVYLAQTQTTERLLWPPKGIFSSGLSKAGLLNNYPGTQHASAYIYIYIYIIDIKIIIIMIIKI